MNANLEYYRVYSLVDITKTGVTRGNGSLERDQQRNYETIQQMISLRAQPQITRRPYRVNGHWIFEFSVETPGVYASDGTADGVDLLLSECQGMPMITGLDEQTQLESQLCVGGTNQNIWFETVNM